MSDFTTIDDRLREIQSVLARAVERHSPVAEPATPAPSAGATPPAAATTLAPPPAAVVVPPPMELPAAPAAVLTREEPPSLPAQPTAEQLAERVVLAPAEARARALLAAAQAEAEQIVADARAEVDALRAQIDELVSVRARLVEATAAASEAPVPAGSPQAIAPRVPAPAPRPAVAPHSVAAPRPAALPQPVAAPARPIAPPQAIPPVASTPPVAAPPAASPGRFGSAGGVVTLTVGPFSDISSIELFERTLITVDALDDVYLRAYEAGRAIFELTLHQPTELVAELDRLAPGVISAVEETSTALVAMLAFTPTPAAS